MTPTVSMGSSMLHLVRTRPFQTGARGVLYLPDGSSVHTLEDLPIPAGTYFMRPDDTGRHRNWVIESIFGSQSASEVRVDVEFHAGNGLVDSDACVLPGMETSLTGVLDSTRALNHMRFALDRDVPNPKTWILVISEAF